MCFLDLKSSYCRQRLETEKKQNEAELKRGRVHYEKIKDHTRLSLPMVFVFFCLAEAVQFFTLYLVRLNITVPIHLPIFSDSSPNGFWGGVYEFFGVRLWFCGRRLWFLGGAFMVLGGGAFMVLGGGGYGFAVAFILVGKVFLAFVGKAFMVLGGGAFMVLGGGVYGFWGAFMVFGAAFMVLRGGRLWFSWGAFMVLGGGAFMALGGGLYGFLGGG